MEKTIDIHICDILEPDNIACAIAYLMRKDIAGADGIKPSMLREYWAQNQDAMTALVTSGAYEPDVVRELEIISGRGKRRRVFSMNAPDRMLARATVQVLSPEIDRRLSDRCFSYRAGMGTREFAGFAAKRIEDGALWVLELDVRDFFGNIPHLSLCKKISELISDETVRRFLDSFVKCRVENDLGVFRMARGILQGSPLSPLLSNLYAMDFDRVCTERYEGYCRFGDDLRIYTNTKKEAGEALAQLRQLIEKEGLSVNEQKTGVFQALSRPCLGYEFNNRNGHILFNKIIRQKREIYHLWQKTGIKEVDHQYHIVNDGVLSKRDFTLLFENQDGKKYIPVESVETLSIYSNVIFSSGFFDMANREGFSINFIDRSGEQVGRFVPKRWKRSFRTELKQIELLNHPKERLKLAKEFQYANLFNIRAALRYYQRRSESGLIREVIAEISEIMQKVRQAVTVDPLMLYEAQARQKYYQCFNTIMDEDDFEFTRRTRRPPRDALNAMISFGNTLLYTRFANEIYRTSLDIRFGIMHSAYKHAESLNLDLADLFKPILVDRTIFTLVNRRMISEKNDFHEIDGGGVYMTYHGKEIFIHEFENKLAQVVVKGNNRRSYADLIRLEVLHLQDYFVRGKAYTPYRYVN